MRRAELVVGPLATAGGALLVLRLLRRSWKLAVKGVAAIVADQRLPAAGRLKDQLRKHPPQA